VYNASAEPVNSAQVIVITRQGERTIETELKPLGNGRYEGSVDGLTTGDYTFTAVAHADGLQLGEDKGRFSVGNLNLEFQDTRMNPQILRQIADAAGGEYFTAGNAGVPGLAASILSQSSFAPRTVVRTNDVELWNWRYTLAMIVLLVSVEWFVRKRSGML
jgi:hypothetical protein